jgi:hypothetical protein
VDGFRSHARGIGLTRVGVKVTRFDERAEGSCAGEVALLGQASGLIAASSNTKLGPSKAVRANSGVDNGLTKAMIGSSKRSKPQTTLPASFQLFQLLGGQILQARTVIPSSTPRRRVGKSRVEV